MSVSKFFHVLSIAIITTAFTSNYVHGQIIVTIVGDGFRSEEGGNGRYAGDGNPATEASLGRPHSVIKDAFGVFYLSDTDNNRIRKITSTGIIMTVAEINSPYGLCFDPRGNLYVASRGGNQIIQIDTLGMTHVVAGTGIRGFSGDGGSATEAQLGGPWDVAVDTAFNVYIADQDNQRIRKITPEGIISTIAGGGPIGNGEGSFSGDGENASQARFSNPQGVFFDGDGLLHIADTLNGRIRRIDQQGIITTIAFGDHPSDGCFDDEGNLYLAEQTANLISKTTPEGVRTIVAGTGTRGYNGDGIPATQAALNNPTGVFVDNSGKIIIADRDNHRIRTVNASVLLSKLPITLILEQVFGEVGSTVFVPMLLTNLGAQPIGGIEFQVVQRSTAVQFDSIITTVSGFLGTTNTVGDTTFIVLYSSTGATIAPGTVTLGDLRYRIAEDAPLCTPFALTLNEVEIGDSLGIALPDSAVSGEIQAGIQGDLNLDRRVSILDVIQLVRILINKTPEPGSTTCAFFIADFNGDHDLDVLDVIGQINTILHITKSVAVPAPTTALIRLGAAQAGASSGLVFPVEIQSDGLIAGFQATVRFDPSDVSVSMPQLTGSTNGLSLDASVQGGALRFVVFGLQPGRGIAAGSGTVLLIPITMRDGSTEPFFELSDVVVASSQAQRVPVTIGSPGKGAAIPTTFALHAAQPNPFNPSTQIAYDVPQLAHVTLIVYNVLGQEVARLVNAVQQPGRYTVTWDGRNAQGQSASSGVYLYRLASSTGFVASRRMALVK